MVTKMAENERIRFKDLRKEQKNRIYLMIGSFTLIFLILLVYFCTSLFLDVRKNNKDWFENLTISSEETAEIEELSKDAQEVTVGTYVENLRRMDFKNYDYRLDIMIWFNWEGDSELNPAENFRIYKGIINDISIIDERYEDGVNYQLVSLDVSISKDYHTKRFPLESHQFRYYIESNSPIEEVLFVADRTNSGFNEGLSITGFKYKRFGITEKAYTYQSTHGDPHAKDTQTTSEVMAAFEINRTDFGLYLKCFIALYATMIWMLISLFVCTYHHVDPLSMIPGALFGAVGNIIIGTNLLPDSSGAGLLEYANIYGVIMILFATGAIISINRVRELQDERYSKYYGRFLFYLITAFAIIGEIIIPLFAYY